MIQKYNLYCNGFGILKVDSLERTYAQPVRTGGPSNMVRSTYMCKAPVPYKHGSTRQSRIVPDPAGSRSGTIRAHFGVFERRRSSNDRRAGGNTAATRTNPDKHGSYTAATRNQHGAHTDDQRPSRTVTAERRTNTDLHGSDTDQHGSNTDQHGSDTDRQKLV